MAGAMRGVGEGRGAAEAQMRDQAGPGRWRHEQGLWHQDTVTQCRCIQHLCKWFVLTTALRGRYRHCRLSRGARRLERLSGAPQLEGCGVGVGGASRLGRACGVWVEDVDSPPLAVGSH